MSLPGSEFIGECNDFRCVVVDIKSRFCRNHVTKYIHDMDITSIFVSNIY